MMLSLLLCCGAFIVGYLFWKQKITINENKVPLGPKPIPIFGNAFQIGFKPHLRLTEWAQRYGGLYRIKVGSHDAVVISNHKILKEIFSEAASAGKLHSCVSMEMTKGPNGLINSEGETWDVQRKFTIRTLRSFGFAKTSMETMILEELQTMIDWLAKREGSLITGVRLFNAPVINSLWRIVTGERCEWEEKRPPILEAADNFFSCLMRVCTNGLFFAPILKSIAPGPFGWTDYKKSVKNMWELFAKSIEEHKENFNSHEMRYYVFYKFFNTVNYFPDNFSSDFIDHHLAEIQNETNPQSSFYKDAGYINMVSGIFDLFFAGSETSSHLLSWTLLYLSEHQEVQKKLQHEIDKVIGSHLPSLINRNRCDGSMPYTEAVIFEVLRIVTAAPFTPHRLEADIIYQGYNLPKGTILFGNIYGCHHDPQIWKDPSNFRPERFLNEDQSKIEMNDALVPFSEGKRRCLGESLGKDTLFLFVAGIFQRFDVLPDPTIKRSVNFEAELGLMLSPKPFKVIFSTRKCIRE